MNINDDIDVFFDDDDDDDDKTDDVLAKLTTGWTVYMSRQIVIIEQPTQDSLELKWSRNIVTIVILTSSVVLVHSTIWLQSIWDEFLQRWFESTANILSNVRWNEW